MLYKQSREDLQSENAGHLNAGSVQHNTSWESRDVYTGEGKSSSSFSFKLFIFSAFLCIFAGAFLFYKMTVNPPSVQSDKISINLVTEPYAEGGQEQKLQVTISNNNSISLDEAKLSFFYDKGGSVTGEVQTETATKAIGQVMSLGVIKVDFPYTLYGALQEKRPLTVRLDYKIKGSNAIFPKETSTEVTLSTPPLFVNIEGVESVISGEQTEYTLVIKNNTSTSSPLSFLSFSAPAGFSLIKVSEPQVNKMYAWIIKSMKPGEEKRIKFTGVFTGVVGEKAALKGVIGSKKADEDKIQELFSMDIKDIAYSKPGLSAKLSLETDRGVSTILRKGDKVLVNIRYKNEGASKISYVEYKALLPMGIDPRQIFVNQNGYYDSSTRSIIWSSDAFDRFLNLGVGQEGVISFSFVLPEDYGDKSIPLEIYYKGVDAQIGKVAESSKDFSFAVSGSSAFNAYTIYKDDMMPNNGPLPPEVDTETTYTAVLTVSSQTDLNNAKVAFTVQSLYVKWLGSAIASSSVAYDTKTKIVLWNVGDLKKRETVTARMKFSIKPSLTHLGTSPALSSRLVFTAEDSVTKEKIEQILDPLTTTIKDGDPSSNLFNVIK